ncbi:15617_t:CDS:2, partial [Acaulospora colombiana]
MRAQFEDISGFDGPPTKEFKLNELLIRPKYVSLELRRGTTPFVKALLAEPRGMVDLELVFDEWSLASPVITHQLSETNENGGENSKVLTPQSLKVKVVDDGPGFDVLHGLGGFGELWERGLRDGSEETWENERNRLLSRPVSNSAFLAREQDDQARGAQLTVHHMAEPCFIDRLPTELLREIFLFSYYGQQERPAKLLYVNRRWHNVALETQTLWSTLYLLICPDGEKCGIRPSMVRVEHEWAASVAIRVFSLEELLKSIGRLGSAKFTLLADSCSHSDKRFIIKDDGLISAAKALISRRCATLIVTSNFILWDSRGLLCELRALKTLQFRARLHYWWKADQIGFLTGLVNSPCLRRVILRRLVAAHITQHHTLFSRVHHLNLHISRRWISEDLEKLGTLLQEIRTLSLQGRGGLLSHCQVSFPSQSLVHLELALIPLSIFSSSVYRSLVVLFLQPRNSQETTEDTLDSGPIL